MTIEFSDCTQPWFSQWSVEGRKTPIAKVYDLKSGHFLALFNAPTIKQKVFKNSESASEWIVKKAEEYYGAEIKTSIRLS